MTKRINERRRNKAEILKTIQETAVKAIPSDEYCEIVLCEVLIRIPKLVKCVLSQETCVLLIATVEMDPSDTKKFEQLR